MKYNININQLAISELSLDMDIFDAAILDYIIVMCNSKNEKIESKRIEHKGDLYTWIDLGNMLKDMPILNISARSSLTRRIRKIKNNDFIETVVKRVGVKTSLFIKLTSKVDSLFVKSNTDDSSVALGEQPVALAQRRDSSSVALKQPIINTNNTIHNTTILLDLFEEFWKHYPKKIAKAICEVKWLKFTPVEALAVVDDVKLRAVKDVGWLDGFAPHPSTYLNQKRWNDEIISVRPGRPKNLDPATPYKKGKYADDKSIIG